MTNNPTVSVFAEYRGTFVISMSYADMYIYNSTAPRLPVPSIPQASEGALCPSHRP